MESSLNRSCISVVLYSEKQSARKLKVFLESRGLLRKDLRLSNIEISADWTPLQNHVDNHGLNKEKHIAIPVLDRALHDIYGFEEIQSMILGYGRQCCALSSSTLGNGKKQIQMETHEFNYIESLLFDIFSKGGGNKLDFETLQERIKNISCPPKLEIFGDDRTLVIPSKFLNPLSDEKFDTLLKDNFGGDIHMRQNAMESIWDRLAEAHGSARVIRRGEIDPGSKIRHSGHSIIWLKDESSHMNVRGPGSKGWITVTEQGIKQSFDLTLVMFSRGNISEKIRFGKLVQPNDFVLDMYAGIGYYTLPALVIGKAKYVYACEWNSNAAVALRYNLQQNEVSEMATVLEGDCRILLAQDHMKDLKFDRISLGLLPSSEGGWRTAVRALNNIKGESC